MKSYQWWLNQKKRVRKKYKLLCGKYLSPKEVRIWWRNWKRAKRRVNRNDKSRDYKRD